MSTKESKDNKKKTAVKPVAPFAPQSRFGGGTSQFQQKSQYKPTPIRITQHKG